jgi:microcystin degradation protein MlrC
MRVGIICFQHESNTFCEVPTTYEHFAADHVLTGEAVRDFFVASKAHHEVRGMFEGLDAAGIEAVPLFSSRAMPYGAIVPDAFDRLVGELMSALRDAGQMDGLLVAPHGAACAIEHRDADGYWLSLVREHVGPAMPMVCTLDPHANLSQAMVDACDATITYRTNPHLDQRQRGLEAADLMVRMLRGECKPTQALVMPPIALNIQSQRTGQEPCLGLYQKVEAVRQRPGVLSASVTLGFPYADTHEMGSAVVVVTDDDRALAGQLAAELAYEMWSRREAYKGVLRTINDVLDEAVQLDGPVSLLDMGDNVGGGGPGDSTLIAQAILDRGLRDVFVCICDPACAREAIGAGAGARVSLTLGGKTDNRHGAPLHIDGVVQSVHEDARYTETQPRHGGATCFDVGPTAIVATDDRVVFQITSQRAFPVTISQLTAFALDPQSFHLIVIKGVHAPAAAYEPFCRHMRHINTPGDSTADMVASLTYQHRRKPLYPWEQDATWSPK